MKLQDNSAYGSLIMDKEKHKLEARRCDICHKEFTRQSNLERHKQLSIMRFLHKCEVCEKEFTRQWNLERHKLIHKESESDMETEPKSMLQKLANGDIVNRATSLKKKN